VGDTRLVNENGEEEW